MVSYRQENALRGAQFKQLFPLVLILFRKRSLLDCVLKSVLNERGPFLKLFNNAIISLSFLTTSHIFSSKHKFHKQFNDFI